MGSGVLRRDPRRAVLEAASGRGHGARQCLADISRVPTLLREEGFEFRFRARDRPEPPHVHVSGNDGRAKVWLRPSVSLASARGYTQQQIDRILKITEEHSDEFLAAWREYFGT